MGEIIDKRDWKEFFQKFNKRHGGERTRLGVFEIRDGVVNDLWLEDGLPLLGIDIDTKNAGQTINITLEHFRHSVDNASTVTKVSREESGGGLDIEDDEGKTTSLRFEDYTVESED